MSVHVILMLIAARLDSRMQAEVGLILEVETVEPIISKASRLQITLSANRRPQQHVACARPLFDIQKSRAALASFFLFM